MSSAIKMLKEIKKDYELDLAFRKQVQENISKERIIALDEALLALEKQEKLRSWLEKEITAGRIKQSRAQIQGENIRQTISMTRLKVLREVKDVLGGLE